MQLSRTKKKVLEALTNDSCSSDGEVKGEEEVNGDSVTVGDDGMDFEEREGESDKESEEMDAKESSYDSKGEEFSPAPAEGESCGAAGGVKKVKIPGLYKPPTHDELQTLKETQNLFKSNLMRLQVCECVCGCVGVGV